MITQSHRIKAVLIFSLCCCFLANAELIVLNYNVSKQFGIVTVPSEATYSIKSFAIQGWVRPSLTMDFQQPSSKIISNYGIIFGASTSLTGWGNNDKATDTFLTTYLNQWSKGEGFIMSYDSNKVFNYLYADLSYTGILGRWFFIYTAYHSDLNQIYFAVKDNYYSRWTENWSANTLVKNPMKKGFFQFSVGSQDISQSTQMNGYVQDAALVYLPTDVYYKSKADLDVYLKGKEPKYIGLTEKKEFTIIGDAADIKPFTQAFATYQGADEYAISGSFKLPTLVSKTLDVLLFRVSTNNPEKSITSYQEGDRALYGYLEKGTKFCFATYSLNKKAANTKISICFPDAVIDTNWLYFYQGYHRNLQKVFSYVRVGEKNYYNLTQTILHVDPNGFYTYFGNDTLTTKATGKYRSVTIEFGPGAYRETLIDSLPPVTPVDPKPVVVIPQTYVDPKLYTSDSSSPKTVESSIVEVKYLDVLKEFAIHFWYRRDLLNPIAADLDGVRTTTQAVAGATEKDTYTNPGDEALSVLYRPHSDGQQPAYIFTTYNDKSASISQTFEYPQSQDQGEWHWIYFGYNKVTSEASYTVTLGDGSTVTKVITGASHPIIGALKSIFGGSGKIAGVPGEFYDLQFVYYNGCYVNTAATVKDYVKAHVATPPSRQPIPASYEFLSSATFSDITKNDYLPLNVVKDGTEITDYSIQTWASWSHLTKKTDKGSVLVSSSLIKPDASYNFSKLGNVVLEISLSTAGVVFTTYNYGYVSSTDSPAVSKTIPLKDYTFDDQWCFYYFGFSRKTNSARGFVNCDTGFSGSVTFPDTYHIISNSIYFSAGLTPLSNQWYGSFYKPTFIVGKDLQTDLTVNSDRPEQVKDCSYAFSECQYTNELAKICENKQAFTIKNVKSVYVPKGLAVVFFKKGNYKGLYVTFIASVECLDSGLSKDPSVQWSKLSALFHQGKILFSNEQGDNLSLAQAKLDFLGKDSLRKKSHAHQKTLGNDEKKEEKEENSKSFFSKLMFWRD